MNRRIEEFWKQTEARTDDEGVYEMDLEEDTYFLEFSSNSSLTETLPNVGDEDLDSDIDGSNGPGTTQLFSISENVEAQSQNAGFVFGVLPIEWKAIKASNIENTNLVGWEVESEYNLHQYEIERSLNSTLDFQQIGTVQFEGNEKVRKTYSFVDSDLNGNGLYYYRIKQVDVNGNHLYSKIVSVEYKTDETKLKKAELEMSFYPNPACSIVNVNFEMTNIEHGCSVDLYNHAGQLVLSKKLDESQLVKGSNEIRLDINTLSTGQYFLVLDADNSTLTSQISVNKM